MVMNLMKLQQKLKSLKKKYLSSRLKKWEKKLELLFVKRRRTWMKSS